ncbi:hypothetical protein BGW36DRAFT_424024 [Talaromyces proteolyticus]|uniref:F-box domain-containing protein n=1 Tax=Talaromyces proteolyticus TaxID=1131652 RepID=A0AAD4Q3F5_9EURO|nr:uncharacterized protein BGW36DRAFT_424024 [Talaromyces proteolyticus]KAH8701723.1 hypothetical protein BGW36DRAFT_424024 [Talaromyces proteolyticus]
MRPHSCSGCCVCGSYLNPSWLEEDAIFLNDEKWEIRHGQRKVLFLDAKELESKYIDKDMASIWTSFYRLILYDFSKGEFTLTGIGQQFNTTFTAPKDAAKAFAGVPPRDRKDFTKIYDVAPDLSWWNGDLGDDYEKIDLRHLPIGIHMSCWKLAQWKLGPGVAENLELFIAIALRTTFGIISGFRGEGNTWPFNIYEIVAMKNSSCAERGGDIISELWSRNLYELQDRVDYDPSRNPWTQNIIDSSRRIKKQISFAQPLPQSMIPDLPLEIWFEILDFLDCKEVSNLGIALQIAIPDRYWRSRAALNLIEIDEIAEEDLNWHYLCLKFEAVYATGEKFESRRYIVDILSNKIKPTYLQNLGKRDFPRLEEVMGECEDAILRYLHRYDFLD